MRKLNNDKTSKKTMSQQSMLAWLVIAHQTEESLGVDCLLVEPLRKKATAMKTERWEPDCRTGSPPRQWICTESVFES